MRGLPRITVAGVRGGCGKTTVTLALVAALRSRQGLAVVPFKKGPDYIDAGWLSLAAGTPCYTLDPFFIPRDALLDSFFRHSHGDICVVEGNRGLYDGMDDDGSFSTAEIAKLLGSPVILVVDCTKMTRTAAAVVLGCMQLDREVRIRGVVLNQIAGARHEAVVRSSIEKWCGLPVMGAIPRMKSGEFPERHMGLTPFQEHHDRSRALSFVGEIGGRYLDVEAVCRVARETGETPYGGEYAQAGKPMEESSQGSRPSVRIGVIRDSAFQFYYPENFEALRENGAELVEIDALRDRGLPAIDALYVGGGFPETHALRLADNEDLRRDVLAMANRGLPVYAECGGLMYLGSSIAVDGARYPMVGLFPLDFTMHRMPQAHGYSVARVTSGNPFYPVGTVLRGHEFHYSSVRLSGGGGAPHFAFTMERGEGIVDNSDGIWYKNVLATYTHTHALGTPEWTRGMIRRAVEFKAGQR